MKPQPPGFISWLLFFFVCGLCVLLLVVNSKQPAHPPYVNTLSKPVSSTPVFSRPVNKDLVKDSSLLHISTPPATTGNSVENGVILSFIGADGRLDRRVARMAAFTIPTGTAPTPFLPAGPFIATIDGEFAIPLWTSVRFLVEGAGEVRVEIDGQAILDSNTELSWSASSAPVRVNRSGTRLRIVYRSPSNREARLRLMWVSEDFSLEPVPAGALRHRSGDPALLVGMQQRHGRELWESQRCDACHGNGEVAAPILTDLGRRIHRDWLAQWILNPDAVRPGAEMPALLAHLPPAQQAQDAADLAAFLLGNSSTAELPAHVNNSVLDNPALVAEGAHRFAAHGCFACHGGETPSVSLRHAGRKFVNDGLEQFLQDPAKMHPSARMPNFAISASEATAIAAYIRTTYNQPFTAITPSKPGDPARGRTLASQHGCANCHGLEQVEPLTIRPLLASVKGGCLSDTPSGKAPRYALEAASRAALIAYCSTPASPKAHPLDDVTRLRGALRCTQCHDLDGAGADWLSQRETAMAMMSQFPAPEDEALLRAVEHPSWERVPLLGTVGDRLHRQAIADMLTGSSPRVRHWQAVRMPAFPAYAQRLADGFAREHGHPSVDKPDPLVAELAPFGQDLCSPDRFKCFDCHSLGENRLSQGVFDAPGPDLHHSARRLRPDFFLLWMLDPMRHDPATRMPKFVPDRSNSQITDVLDGDAERQFEAIRTWLRSP